MDMNKMINDIETSLNGFIAHRGLDAIRTRREVITGVIPRGTPPQMIMEALLRVRTERDTPNEAELDHNLLADIITDIVVREGIPIDAATRDAIEAVRNTAMREEEEQAVIQAFADGIVNAGAFVLQGALPERPGRTEEVRGCMELAVKEHQDVQIDAAAQAACSENQNATQRAERGYIDFLNRERANTSPGVIQQIEDGCIDINCIGHGADGYVYKIVLDLGEGDGPQNYAVKIAPIRRNLSEYGEIMARWKYLQMPPGVRAKAKQTVVFPERTYLDGRPGVSLEAQRLVIVQPFVEGITLDRVMRDRDLTRRGEYTMWFLRDISFAIRQLYSVRLSESLIHRDLKPENILLEDNGRAKLIDLGFAAPPFWWKDEVGTPSHMSPEMTMGIGTIPICDVWSYGVILYLLATGKEFGALVPEDIRHRRMAVIDFMSNPDGIGAALRDDMEQFKTANPFGVQEITNAIAQLILNTLQPEGQRISIHSLCAASRSIARSMSIALKTDYDAHASDIDPLLTDGAYNSDDFGLIVMAPRGGYGVGGAAGHDDSESEPSFPGDDAAPLAGRRTVAPRAVAGRRAVPAAGRRAVVDPLAGPAPVVDPLAGPAPAAGRRAAPAVVVPPPLVDHHVVVPRDPAVAPRPAVVLHPLLDDTDSEDSLHGYGAPVVVHPAAPAAVVPHVVAAPAAPLAGHRPRHHHLPIMFRPQWYTGLPGRITPLSHCSLVPLPPLPSLNMAQQQAQYLDAVMSIVFSIGRGPWTVLDAARVVFNVQHNSVNDLCMCLQGYPPVALQNFFQVLTSTQWIYATGGVETYPLVTTYCEIKRQGVRVNMGQNSPFPDWPHLVAALPPSDRYMMEFAEHELDRATTSGKTPSEIWRITSGLASGNVRTVKRAIKRDAHTRGDRGMSSFLSDCDSVIHAIYLVTVSLPMPPDQKMVLRCIVEQIERYVDKHSKKGRFPPPVAAQTIQHLGTVINTLMAIPSVDAKIINIIEKAKRHLYKSINPPRRGLPFRGLFGRPVVGNDAETSDVELG